MKRYWCQFYPSNEFSSSIVVAYSLTDALNRLQLRFDTADQGGVTGILVRCYHYNSSAFAPQGIGLYRAFDSDSDLVLTSEKLTDFNPTV